jgi:hypothetical protein
MLIITSKNIISISGLSLINMKYGKKLGNKVSFSCLYHHPNKISLIVSLTASVISIGFLIAILIYLLS